MVYFKFSFYAFLILQINFFLVFVVSLPAGEKVQFPSQMQVITQATKGMKSSMCKANMCQRGSHVASKIGWTSQAEKLKVKAKGHMEQHDSHEANLRNAIETSDPTHEFGGAKSRNEQHKAIKKGLRMLRA